MFLVARLFIAAKKIAIEKLIHEPLCRGLCFREKVRKRRDDAEAEREEMDRLKAEESRLREQQQYGDWQKKEEQFHLKQASQRSKVGTECRFPGFQW